MGVLLWGGEGDIISHLIEAEPYMCFIQNIISSRSGGGIVVISLSLGVLT